MSETPVFPLAPAPADPAPRDRCPACGSTATEVRREGMTGQCGTVICSRCGAEIREWDAY